MYYIYAYTYMCVYIYTYTHTHIYIHNYMYDYYYPYYHSYSYYYYYPYSTMSILVRVVAAVELQPLLQGVPGLAHHAGGHRRQELRVREVVAGHDRRAPIRDLQHQAHRVEEGERVVDGEGAQQQGPELPAVAAALLHELGVGHALEAVQEPVRRAGRPDGVAERQRGRGVAVVVGAAGDGVVAGGVDVALIEVAGEAELRDEAAGDDEAGVKDRERLRGVRALLQRLRHQGEAPGEGALGPEVRLPELVRAGAERQHELAQAVVPEQRAEGPQP